MGECDVTLLVQIYGFFVLHLKNHSDMELKVARKAARRLSFATYDIPSDLNINEEVNAESFEEENQKEEVLWTKTVTEATKSHGKPLVKKTKLIETSVAKPITEPERQEPPSTEPVPVAPIIEQVAPTTTIVGVPTTEIPQEPPIENIVPTTETISTMEIDGHIADQATTKDAGVGTTIVDQDAPVIVGGNEEESAGNDAETQENVSVKDSTSSAVSEKELSEMKKKNPLAALRLMLSLSISSTNIANSSSTTSLTSINQESAGGLLRQLKAKVLEGDLLARIGENSLECFEIKELLQKLHKSEPSQELLAFLVEFGPNFETLSINVRKRTEVIQQKNQEVKLHQKKLNSLKASQDKINDLETQAATNEKALADWDAKIQQFNEEIRIIQSKLKNAEYQRSLVQERMGTPTSKIEAEAVEAIKHFDDATQHQTTIAQLDKELGHLETSIAVSAKIVDRLKDALKTL